MKMRLSSYRRFRSLKPPAAPPLLPAPGLGSYRRFRSLKPTAKDLIIISMSLGSYRRFRSLKRRDLVGANNVVQFR